MTGRRLGNNEWFRSLIEDGPHTVRDHGGESPSSTTKQYYDIKSFAPFNQNPVWYLNEYHDRERVLRIWIDEAMGFLELFDKSSTTVYRKLPRKFQPVFQEICDEYDHFDGVNMYNGGNTPEKSPCPMCGDPVKVVADHIRNDH